MSLFMSLFLDKRPLLIAFNYFDLSQVQIVKTGRIILSDDGIQWEILSQLKSPSMTDFQAQLLV